jgi:hypothetical protein
MAQFNQSAFGVIKGKVGNMVITQWKDQHVAKGVPKKSSKAATATQLDQRARMRLAGSFMRVMKEVVSTCYQDNSNKMTAYNAAVKDLLLNAITGEYPNYTINYPLVTLARGDVRFPFNPAVASPKTDTLAFSWATHSGLGFTRPNDKSILVAYCEKLQVSACVIQGPPRSEGKAELELPGMGGQEMHTWVAFISADGKDVCNSVYAGKVTLAGQEL